ncbi:hypothetical protein DS909_08880 [Phaeobacter gallaeciensis]|uniref:Uncharacterized protein n=1 Tax=Phaeobacter gallaeciensis TaxID=60890 RepID=A0A366X352_9RHOB|nr:hypothetical protein [Phaeobacter gallaeciensis]RBW56808.1 hypothetical protein DS909_08880 [Phaeobacter gallaeciensis]
MTNPFRSGGAQSAGDALYIEGKRLTGGGGGSDPNAVVFDPVAKTANASGIAFVEACATRVAELLMPVIDQRERALRDDITAVFGEVHQKTLNPRFQKLEAALDVNRKEVADAIEQAVGDFLGDDAPTMDELNAMHERHKKDMKNV